MIKAISTGKNESYGKKGKESIFPDDCLDYVIRNKIVDPTTIEFIRGKWNKSTVPYKERIIFLPEKRVYIHDQLDLISNAFNSIRKRIDFIESKQKELIKLIKEQKN